MALPQDPIMLMSVVNTKLRDQYSSLEALAEGEDMDSLELRDMLRALKKAGFRYDEEANQFR